MQEEPANEKHASSINDPIMFHYEAVPTESRAWYHDAYDKLADTVNVSLRSYLWVIDHFFYAYPASDDDIHTIPMLLLMEYAEPIDGVSILARTGSAANCVPLIRCGFELQLNLMYMLERDDVYRNRCLAYEFFHWMKLLKKLKKYDPDSDAGKQVRSQIRGELLANIFDEAGRDFAANMSFTQKLLNDPRYADVKLEYERSSPKHWYGMWGGPNNLEGLARALKRLGQYEAMYRHWSMFAHGEGAWRRQSSKGGKLVIECVRSPHCLPGLCLHAVCLANEMTMFLLTRFLPALLKEYKSQYFSPIKAGIDYINSVTPEKGFNF